jgi:hypothetical protein
MRKGNNLNSIETNLFSNIIFLLKIFSMQNNIVFLLYFLFNKK